MEADLIWLLLAALFILDLLFTASRASFTYLRESQLEQYAETNSSSVEKIQKLMDLSHLPATLRMSVVLVHFLMAGIGGWLAVQWMQEVYPWWGILGLLVFAFLTLSVEFILEGRVLKSVELWAVRLLPVVQFQDGLFRPLARLLMRMLGADTELKRSLGSMTDDELKTWAEESLSDENTLEKGERRMIYSIFHFSDTLCREIMVPRIDVFALDVNTSPPEAIKMVLESGHSRLPVYEEGIDNIIGLLYAKDLLEWQVNGNNNMEREIRTLLKPAYFIPEAKRVDKLLREMQARGVHLSVVVDEYGGMAGLVTLEDIVEEIVGEIRDEYDQLEEDPYEQVSADEYVFQGRIDIEDINDLIGTHLTREISDTLAGFIIGEIGAVPEGGESVEVEDWVLTVEQVIGRSIRSVRAKRIPQPEEMEGEQENGK
ncbi:MAG: hemolysin family protein [Anaerolineaceae bacterium]|jgi:CBS domain containing-hemolysin-like protein|nr:hemolysin family protein [Anaerolineaceae bacterium]